jgi:thiamine kinase-like enzyme
VTDPVPAARAAEPVGADEPGGDLHEVLDRLPALAGTPRAVRPLAGGLTNRNYDVTTPSGRFVVRLSDRTTNLLAIDREREFRNTAAAAAAGVGPRVAGYLEGEGVLAVEYIDAVTLTDEQVRANLDRIARACRRLHTGPAFVGDFDMFAIQREYRRIVGEHGFTLPPRYDSYADRVAGIERALAVRPPARVPCNNDLLAANFLDDGERIWIIDYEYSGTNDPCFELGNLASECRLSIDELDQLVTSYHGAARPARVARCQLFSLMSHYGWTLWASIQASTSTIDFDFWTWGLAKYEQAEQLLADPGLDDLLREVTLDD